MTDVVQIENLIANLRSELQTISQRADVFGMLPLSVRDPILTQLHEMVIKLREEVAAVRAFTESEISRQRGDEMDDYRTKFRQATGG